MPIFEYRCKQCQCDFEAFVISSHDADEIQCPKCGGQDVEKLMSCFSRMGGDLSSGAGCSTGGFT